MRLPYCGSPPGTCPAGWRRPKEPPEDAVRREPIEEVGLRVTLHGLLVVDWVAPLAFIFDDGTLDHDNADRLQPRDEELPEARVRHGLQRRTSTAGSDTATPV
ncbi:NUDIX domain-containing protein [Streptomyces yerevanensis]|uniref:NUDIX domain-containing protein n=1 Tax=Streptomyces yerevanensis TaxID=66378 RepID=UPI00316ADA44